MKDQRSLRHGHSGEVPKCSVAPKQGVGAARGHWWENGEIPVKPAVTLLVVYRHALLYDKVPWSLKMWMGRNPVRGLWELSLLPLQLLFINLKSVQKKSWLKKGKKDIICNLPLYFSTQNCFVGSENMCCKGVCCGLFLQVSIPKWSGESVFVPKNGEFWRRHKDVRNPNLPQDGSWELSASCAVVWHRGLQHHVTFIHFNFEGFFQWRSGIWSFPWGFQWCKPCFFCSLFLYFKFPEIPRRWNNVF